MKLRVLLPLFVALITTLISLPGTAQAHEVIPKAVLEYVQANPDATPEQIERFTQQNAPEFAESTNGGSDILEIARNQDSSFLDNSFDFIRLGIEHILSGPDHILFVLTLLLVFISFRKSLKLITAFTVAHSVTLVLAGLSILTLSSSIVEPIIALSISFMAIATVFFRNHRYLGGDAAKVGIVFFFGLFHGLGFAGLLREIQIPPDKFLSSLISFNIGVEFGQLFIILLALPLIYAFRNRSGYNRVIQGVAVLIAIVGIVWAVQRVSGM